MRRTTRQKHRDNVNLMKAAAILFVILPAIGAFAIAYAMKFGI